MKAFYGDLGGEWPLCKCDDESWYGEGHVGDCPVQILWGGKGALGAWYDVLGLWREWADDVTGQAIDCGHFIPEEKPVETLAALRAFFLG